MDCFFRHKRGTGHWVDLSSQASRAAEGPEWGKVVGINDGDALCINWSRSAFHVAQSIIRFIRGSAHPSCLSRRISWQSLAEIERGEFTTDLGLTTDKLQTSQHDVSAASRMRQ